MTGSKAKTDRRGSLRSAALLGAGERISVWVPGEDNEITRSPLLGFTKPTKTESWGQPYRVGLPSLELPLRAIQAVLKEPI